MRRLFARGSMVFVLVHAATAAWAQDATAGGRHLRWHVEAAAGLQLDYTGTIQSVAIGFSPTRSLTLLASAERSRTDDEIEVYPDGYSLERGGVVEFVSAEVRYAFLADRRISPSVVGGAGAGMERPNVTPAFPHGVDRRVVATYVGGGARIRLNRRLDAFADMRFVILGDDAAEMAVLGPVRAGIAVRF